MRTILSLAILATAIAVQAAATTERVTATLDLINYPSPDDNLAVNGSTRTWKASVSTPASEILIGANVGGCTTNLWRHILANGFTGPVMPVWGSTNQLRLVGAVGQAMTVTASGAWATISYSTQTVAQATVVRVPIATEPNLSVRTNVASQLVADIFNSGLSSNAIAADSPVMAHFVSNGGPEQTITGVKTWTGTNSFSASQSKWSGGVITNASVGNLRMPYSLTNNGLVYFALGGSDPSYAVAPDINGRPSIFTVTINGSGQRVLGTFLPYAPSDNNLLTFSVATNRFGQFVAANVWIGTNQFTLITNSTISGSTISGSVITNATLETMSGGQWNSGVASNLVHRGALRSYVNDPSNVEIGPGAAVTNTFTGGTAVGQNARVGASSGTAIGNGASAVYANSTALGNSAAATAANQVRLGTATEHISAPGGAKFGGSTFVGNAEGMFVAGLANGRQMTNGAAASADPANGIADWSVSGEWQYRSAAASEGAGQVNRVHNRGAQVTGSGSDFAITGTGYARVDFGGTDPELSLPTAGTYLITATVSIAAGASANDDFRAKLYNSSDSADVTSSDRRVTTIAASQTGQLVLQNIVTVAAAKTIQLYAQNLTAGRGAIEAARTSLIYVRLY